MIRSYAPGQHVLELLLIMAEITINETPRSLQDLYNRAFAAFERGNMDYAIDLFGSVLKEEPRLLVARRYLRAAEIKKRRDANPSALSSHLVWVTAFPVYLKAMIYAGSKSPEKGVLAGEALLKKDPLNPSFAQVFARAACQANLPEAAIQTLEIVLEHHPDEVMVVKRLGALLADVGETGKARVAYERLAELRPRDPDVQKLLKDSIAIDSMAQDGWASATGEGKTFRDVMKDTDEAVMLERENKAVKSDSDAQALIADAVQKIEEEPDNITCYRSLGRLYAQQRMFDEAIEVLQAAVEKSPGDPELERALSVVHRQRFDAELALAQEQGDQEAIDHIELARAQYILDDLGDRVQRYPNDLSFKFEYGIALLENGNLNEAIQLFQASQRSPKHRLRALYHLSVCFKEKGQLDLAAEQLTTALSEIPVMDGTKKDVLYELGQVYDALGDDAQALNYYKQIYQVDIGFRDVAERVEGGG